MQADREIGIAGGMYERRKQANSRQTGKQADRQTGRQAGIEAVRQVGRPTERQKRQTGKKNTFYKMARKTE
jgi:hypothetical protein